MMLPPKHYPSGRLSQSGTPHKDSVFLNEGALLIEVDDIMEGGNARHDSKMDEFYKKFKCGKKVVLQDTPEGTRISGIRVKQHKDFSFTYDMNEYAKNNMKVIDKPRGFYSNTKEIDDPTLSEVVTSNGKIGWIGTNGRPDVAAAHSIIAGGYKDKSPQLVKDCNDAVLHCQREPIEIKIWPIPPEDIRFVAWCDSSFDNNNVRHQIGWLDGVTTKYLNDGRKAPVSLLGWRSRKLPRKSGSPQLCETYAGSYCTADLNWVKCLLWSCFYANYDMLTQRPAHKPLPVRGPTVVRSDRPATRMLLFYRTARASTML